jgi:hypothetical protein
MSNYATFLAIVLASSSSSILRAEDDALINKDLAFRKTIFDQPAPRKMQAMIDDGDVTTTFVGDMGDTLGKTHYFLDFDWTFDYKYSISQRDDRNILKLSVLKLKHKIKRRHVVRMPLAYYDPGVWRTQLMRHEFDHVAVSIDQRPILMLKHLCKQMSTIEHVLESPGKPSKELCLGLVNNALRRRQNAVIDLVRANYVLLDKVSMHGMIPVPNRGKFFVRLYTKQNLQEQRFPFADEVADLLETPEYRSVKVRNLATDPTVPVR